MVNWLTLLQESKEISMRRLLWQKMYNTYSLFEQMYGNFYRYLVAKIICSFCPKRYMEITVDFFGREFTSISPIARSSNWDITRKSSYTCDLKGCQVFKQNISIICYTSYDFWDVIKLSTIEVWRRICRYHIIVPAKQDFDELWCKILEVNWIKLTPR